MSNTMKKDFLFLWISFNILFLCFGCKKDNNNIDIEEFSDNTVNPYYEEISSLEEKQKLTKITKIDDIITADGMLHDLITEYEYYEEENRVIEISHDSSGNKIDDIKEYYYDDNDNLTRINEYIKDKLALYTLYEYNESNDIIKESIYIQPEESNEVSEENFVCNRELIYKYDTKGNLNRKDVYSLGKEIELWCYEYDNNENLTKATMERKDEEPLVFLYTYDNLNRLIDVSASNGLKEKYTYINEESKFIEMKEVSVPAYSTFYYYQYNKEGNLIEEKIECTNDNSIKRIQYEYN